MRHGESREEESLLEDARGTIFYSPPTSANRRAAGRGRSPGRISTTHRARRRRTIAEVVTRAEQIHLDSDLRLRALIIAKDGPKSSRLTDR